MDSSSAVPHPPRRRRSALKGVVIEYDNYDHSDIHNYILSHGKVACSGLFAVSLLLMAESASAAVIGQRSGADSDMLLRCSLIICSIQASIFLLSVTSIKKHFTSRFPYEYFAVVCLLLLASLIVFLSLIFHLWKHIAPPSPVPFASLSFCSLYMLLVWHCCYAVLVVALVYILRLRRSSDLSRSNIDSRLTSYVILRSTNNNSDESVNTSLLAPTTSTTSVSSGYGSIPASREEARNTSNRRMSRRVRMRRSSIGACPEQFVVGARVLSQYGVSDSELWFPATISRINRDGTFDIIYFDGDIELRKPAHRIEILSHVDQQQQQSSSSRSGSRGLLMQWGVGMMIHFCVSIVMIVYLLVCLHADIFALRIAVLCAYILAAIVLLVQAYGDFIAVLHDAVYGIDMNILDLAVCSVEAVTDISMHSTSSKVKPTELFSL